MILIIRFMLTARDWQRQIDDTKYHLHTGPGSTSPLNLVVRNVNTFCIVVFCTLRNMYVNERVALMCRNSASKFSKISVLLRVSMDCYDIANMSDTVLEGGVGLLCVYTYQVPLQP